MSTPLTSRPSSSPMEAKSLDRRALLLAGAVGATVLASTAAGAEEDHKDHHKHTPAGGEHAGHAGHQAPAKYEALVNSALACVARGDICVAHCIGTLAAGDTSLKDCLTSVQMMMPMCVALGRAAALDTPRLKEIVKVCLAVCEDCEKECKKHAEHHAACKACMESCGTCIAECKKVL